MSSKKMIQEETSPKKKSRDDVLSLIDEDESSSVSFLDSFTSSVSPVRSKENPIKDDVDIYEDDIHVSKLVKAPDEWNFFSVLNTDKTEEMMESIMRLGLLNRVILWEKEDGHYMILSGHNRLNAFNKLYEITKDNKFLKLPSRIYRPSAIDEFDAREIIIDSNWAQRVLSVSEKIRSIVEKVKIYTEKAKRDKSIGRVRDLVAEKHNMKGRMVAYYIKLENLIPELLELINERKLQIKVAAKLAEFPADYQQALYYKYKDRVDKKTFIGINPHMDKEEIERVIVSNIQKKETRDEIQFSKVTIEIPYGKDKEIADLIEEWRQSNNIEKEHIKISFK